MIWFLYRFLGVHYIVLHLMDELLEQVLDTSRKEVASRFSTRQICQKAQLSLMSDRRCRNAKGLPTTNPCTCLETPVNPLLMSL